MRSDGGTVRAATALEASVVAGLLDAFNREFETETPGVMVLSRRMERLLVDDNVLALLAEVPATGVALLTLRPSPWFDGPVAVLDELYVAPMHRGRGLGAELLHAAEVAVSSRQGALVEVNVDGADVDARRFYERHGYSNVDAGQELPSYYYYRELAF